MAKTKSSDKSYSLRQEENGTWTLRFFIGYDPDTGKKKETTRRGFRTEREAKAALAKLQIEKEEGLKLASDKPFSDFLKSWSETKKKVVKQTTWRQYQSYIDYYLEDIKHIKLNKIKTYDIERMFDNLRSGERNDGKKGNISERTLLHFYNFLNQIFESARKNDYISKNPLEKIDKPRPRKTDQNIWSIDEVNHFLDHAKDQKAYHLFAFLLLTGARIGEALAVTWDKIDFDKKTVKINQEVAFVKKSINNNKSWTFSTTKTQSSNRMISIDNRLINILKELKANDQKNNTYNLVFHTKNGNPFLHGNLTRHWNTAIKNVGMNRIRIHDTRHTHASMLEKMGVPFSAIQKRLGHSSVSTTLSVYTHADSESEREIVTMLNELNDK